MIGILGVRLKRITGLSLLLLFVAYYGGNTLFTHVHMDGTTRVVHSHPYSKGTPADPQHTHTAKSFDLIKLFSLQGFVAAVVMALFFGSLYRLCVPIIGRVFRLCSAPVRFYALRAPPLSN